MALKEEFRKQGDFLFKYRSYIPGIIIIVGYIVYFMKYSTGTILSNTNAEYYELACIFISLLGFGVRFFAVGFSGEKTSGRNTLEGQVAETINTRGLYSACRHPLYLGNFLIWFGVALFTMDLGFVAAFVFMFWVYYERIMYAEEEFLRDKFGETYLNWANQTSAFIPNLRKWKKPKTSFQWKKVLRQEKSGILNLAIVLFFFDVLRQFATTNTYSFEFNYRVIVLFIVLIYYIIMKVIQKSSNKK